MKTILIAIDDRKGTENIFEKTIRICKCMSPEEIVLLYVEKLEGRSLMDEMLGDTEMSTLKEALEGAEFKDALDKKAERILNHYKALLQSTPPSPAIRTVVKTGHPAEEILKASEEENVDIIFIGSRGHRVGRLLMGSVSREVANNAEVPVLLVK